MLLHQVDRLFREHLGVTIPMLSDFEPKGDTARALGAYFEPAGFTKNPEIPMAKSLVDYIFRWMGSKFLSPEEQTAIGVISRDSSSQAPAPVTEPKRWSSK